MALTEEEYKKWCADLATQINSSAPLSRVFDRTYGRNEMRWSEQTVEQRVRNVLKHYKKLLDDIDQDNTALLHETYLSDRVLFTTAFDYTGFIQILEKILEPQGESNDQSK